MVPVDRDLDTNKDPKLSCPFEFEVEPLPICNTPADTLDMDVSVPDPPTVVATHDSLRDEPN